MHTQVNARVHVAATSYLQKIKDACCHLAAALHTGLDALHVVIYISDETSNTCTGYDQARTEVLAVEKIVESTWIYGHALDTNLAGGVSKHCSHDSLAS